MNREIKFRAWDKIDKKIRKVTCLNFFDEMIYMDETLDGNYRIRREEEVELMQFTGLTDKNGKEIYEGDVLKVKDERSSTNEKGELYYDYKNAKVVWYFDGYKAELANGEIWDNKCSYEDFSNDVDWEKTEVIGNQFESPELLN